MVPCRLDMNTALVQRQRDKTDMDNISKCDYIEPLHAIHECKITRNHSKYHSDMVISKLEEVLHYTRWKVLCRAHFGQIINWTPFSVMHVSGKSKPNMLEQNFFCWDGYWEAIQTWRGRFRSKCLGWLLYLLFIDCIYQGILSTSQHKIQWKGQFAPLHQFKCNYHFYLSNFFQTPRWDLLQKFPLNYR